MKCSFIFEGKTSPALHCNICDVDFGSECFTVSVFIPDVVCFGFSASFDRSFGVRVLCWLVVP